MYILLQTFVANNVEFSIVFLHVVYADAKIVRYFDPSAYCSDSYTSASIRASNLSSSVPLPAATLSASWRFVRTAYGVKYA